MQEALTFGAWLRQRRKALGLTQDGLAERVGCSSEMVRKLEAGAARPSRPMAEALIAGLDFLPAAQPALVDWARAGGRAPVPRPNPPAASAPLTPAAPSRPALPTGIVTFLFTDIEGSTAHWEHHPAAMKAALAQHDVLVRAAIVGQCGVIFQNAGDSFGAAFVTAHTALAAALAGQRALQAARWPATVGALRVRMALHTGPAEERADGWHAEHTLNRLARLLAAGHGGQVLLSGVTRDLLQEHLPAEVTLRDLGLRRLKDVREALPVFQVIVPDLPVDFPPLKTLERPPSNLPVALTEFIGREQELAAMTTLLRRESVRLVTLTGPGGTGKTRLSIQAAAALADDFADGVWFVELAPLTDPGLVVSTIATTLQVPESGGQDLLVRLQDVLREKQVLLVLDNFEHVLAAGRVVEALLRAVPRLKVLATSRTILHIYGEREFLVPPLSLPDRQHLPPLAQVGQYEAVRLFVERAQAVKPGFALTPETAPAIVEICWRLDGLPLALELAAARSRLFSPAALLARLDARLTTLTGGSWTLPERQQTLRGAIDWSYHLLAQGEQQLFRRLAVFRGGSTLDAAAAICNAVGDLQSDLLTGIQSLADKSLLRLGVGGDNEPRVMMLETIQEYAQEKLEESEEAASLRQQHAAFMLRLAEQMEAIHSQLLTPAGKVASILDQLEEEQDNIRTALQWTLQAGEVGVGLRLAGLLGEFWYYHSHLREGCQWLEQLLAQAGDTPVPISVRARALNALGGLLWPLEDMERARRTLEESLALFRDLEDQWWIADVLNNLGNLSMNTGDLEQALRYHEEALALRRALGDRRARQSLFGLGLITEQLGAYDRAAVFYEEADALARAAGGPAPYPSRGMGRVALQRNDLAKALAYFRESLGLFWGVGMKEGVAWCLLDIARAAALAGQPERAVRLFGAAETTLQVIGVPIGWDNPQANGVALLQAQVAAAEWQSAYAAGRALPLEQAVAAAMQDAD